MIRVALDAHAHPFHFMLVGACAVAVMFLAFLGALFSARCAWQRRHRWADTLRRGIGLKPARPRKAAAPAGDVFGPLARYGQFQTTLPQRIPARPAGRTVTVGEEEYARLMLRDVELDLLQAAARRVSEGIDRAVEAVADDPDA
jgi:hypothetical protein